MSVEDRLRSGLRAESQLMLPRTEDQLELVTGRKRRRQAWRWGGVGVAAAAATVVGVSVVPGLLPSDGGSAPAESPTLTGTYVVEVSNSADAAQEDMVGRWSVTVSKDGNLDIEPPSSYEHLTSGAAYSVEGDELSTNAFLDHPGCQTTPLGRYAWTIEGTTLAFDLVDDDCPARLVLFGGQTWERTS